MSSAATSDLNGMTSLSVGKKDSLEAVGGRSHASAFWPSRVFKFMGWAVGEREGETGEGAKGEQFPSDWRPSTDGRDNGGRRALSRPASRPGRRGRRHEKYLPWGLWEHKGEREGEREGAKSERTAVGATERATAQPRVASGHRAGKDERTVPTDGPRDIDRVVAEWRTRTGILLTPSFSLLSRN